MTFVKYLRYNKKLCISVFFILFIWVCKMQLDIQSNGISPTKLAALYPAALPASLTGDVTLVIDAADGRIDDGLLELLPANVSVLLLRPPPGLPPPAYGCTRCDVLNSYKPRTNKRCAQK